MVDSIIDGAVREAMKSLVFQHFGRTASDLFGANGRITVRCAFLPSEDDRELFIMGRVSHDGSDHVLALDYPCGADPRLTNGIARVLVHDGGGEYVEMTDATRVRSVLNRFGTHGQDEFRLNLSERQFGGVTYAVFRAMSLDLGSSLVPECGIDILAIIELSGPSLVDIAIAIRKGDSETMLRVNAEMRPIVLAAVAKVVALYGIESRQ
jgi:hypothetical protein